MFEAAKGRRENGPDGGGWFARSAQKAPSLTPVSLNRLGWVCATIFCPSPCDAFCSVRARAFSCPVIARVIRPWRSKFFAFFMSLFTPFLVELIHSSKHFFVRGREGVCWPKRPKTPLPSPPTPPSLPHSRATAGNCGERIRKSPQSPRGKL